MNRYTIKYEFLNTLYNGYAIFFGAIFPVLLIHLIIGGSLSDVPKEFLKEASTAIFLGMAMYIPLASIFLSHSATYSNELDKNIPERLVLFGFPEREILLNKLVSNYIFFTFCIIIYLAGTLPFIDIFKPKFKAIALWILCLYILAGILLILAHGIATLIRKFGPTYGISMALYFIFLILGGYMGLPVSKLPKALRYISDLLPTTNLGSDFLDFWVGRDYNFAPLIQSMIFFLALSLVILISAFKIRGRKN